MNAKCFKCGADFPSDNPDDLYGDGQCANCIDKGKRIAFKLDIEFAQKRANNPAPVNERAAMIQDLIHNPGNTRINLRDLGIEPHD